MLKKFLVDPHNFCGYFGLMDFFNNFFWFVGFYCSIHVDQNQIL